MRRILTISLSAHWTAVFAIMAAKAAMARAPGAEGLAWLVPPALAIGHGVIAALFLWTVVAAIGGRREEGGAAAIARPAFAAATFVLTLGVVAAYAGIGPQSISLAAVQLAALGATYLVVRMEDAEAGRPVEQPDYSHAVARRMAAGAAHSSMLTRLSGRRPNVLETDG